MKIDGLPAGYEPDTGPGEVYRRPDGSLFILDEFAWLLDEKGTDYKAVRSGEAALVGLDGSPKGRERRAVHARRQAQAAKQRARMDALTYGEEDPQ
jgi:hypothetical protein